MQNYSRFNFTDFVILAGYKSFQIKEYFANFWLHDSDIEVNLSDSTTSLLGDTARAWNIKVLETGLNTLTGGRILRAKKYVQGAFFLTYGDGVADVDIKKLLVAHKEGNRLVTLSAVRPPSRFGALTISGSEVSGFQEKPSGENDWINGGFFVCEESVLDLITGDNCSFEYEILPALAKSHQLGVYKHEGSWHPVDNIRDLERLQESLERGDFPWVSKLG
jgi:glucose-1-phosphate cytidylyltransferase